VLCLGKIFCLYLIVFYLAVAIVMLSRGASQNNFSGKFIRFTQKQAQPQQVEMPVKTRDTANSKVYTGFYVKK